MTNSWSLLYDELHNDEDEDKQLKDIELSGGFEWTPVSPCTH